MVLLERIAGSLANPLEGMNAEEINHKIRQLEEQREQLGRKPSELILNCHGIVTSEYLRSNP